MSEVNDILEAMRNGDRQASDRLLPLVYNELRHMAMNRMAHEPAGHTLQATALVHEAYVRLVGSDGSGETPRWDHRGHFMMAAAEAMRRILVERARRRRTVKHGGEHSRIDIKEAESEASPPDDSKSLLELNEAMARFESEHPEEAKLVTLRYFAGLKIEEAAEAMGISRATAARYWAFARAWLHKALT